MNTQRSIIHMRLLLVMTALTACSCAKKPPSIKQLNFDSAVETSIEGDDKRTAQSIKKFDGFYTVTYYGNYEERLEWLQDYHIKKASEISRSYSCSLFTSTMHSGEPIFGRNFDRRNEIPVLTKCSPPGKYASFSFSPFSEIQMSNVAYGSDYTEEELGAFLTCLPFYATDGINEKGLVIALAGTPQRKVKRSEGKRSMFVLRFVREVLDNCATIEEVVDLIKSIDLYDKSINLISHHFLIVEPSGKWMVIDYPEGTLRITTGSGKPTCRTNHFLEGGPAHPEAPDSFKRYNSITRRLNATERLKTSIEAMDLLKSAANATAWSVIYEPQTRSALLAVGENYKELYRFKFNEDNEK